MVSHELEQWVAKEADVRQAAVHKVITLLNGGNTVPFIARYRKEETGGLDEVQLKLIQDKWQYAVNLAERKEEVIRLIDEQGKLTDELKQEINAASQLQRVEDLYRPYKQKRRTRATKAKEKGLEPLAVLVWEQETPNIAAEAEAYLSEEQGVDTVDDALAGVNDIIAEWVSDEPKFRTYIREETFKRGTMHSEAKKC